VRALTLLGLVLLFACGPSRDEQVEKCAYLSGSGGMGECLVSRYEWSVRDASIASLDYMAEQRAAADSASRAEEIARFARDTFRLMDRQDGNLFAYITPQFEHDTAMLRLAGRRWCGDRVPCVVRFWSDQSIRHFRLPLDSHLSASLVATFSIEDRRQPGRIAFRAEASR
jgi:hypothetical protein